LILNAPNSFAECRPPLRILHVVTDLKHRPESPGPEAHHTMMIADGWRVGPRCDFDSYKIHAPSLFALRHTYVSQAIEGG
jgi:hypothetical protein